MKKGTYEYKVDKEDIEDMLAEEYDPRSPIEIMIDKANEGNGDKIDSCTPLSKICENCCFFEKEYVEDNGYKFYHNYGRCKLHIGGNTPGCATYLQRTMTYNYMQIQDEMSNWVLKEKDKLRIMDTFYIKEKSTK